MLQITLNGPLAKTHHQNEIEALFVDIRKSLIEVSNLVSVTKAFLLMSLDLYYNGFKKIDTNLERFYGKFLDDHDEIEKRNRPQSMPLTNDKIDEPTNSTYSLRNLKKDFAGLKTNYKSNGGHGSGGGHNEHRKINREYLNRPLKASDRLKYFQNSNSELTSHARQEEFRKSPRNQSNNGGRILKESSSEGNVSQHNSINNNDNENPIEPLPTRNALLNVTTNCQDSAKSDGAASPIDSQEIAHISPPKLENFNWFEAVEREEFGEYIPPNSINNSSGSNKFDTLSVASYSSNATSPQERVSPQSSHTNRSRRNSLNRFRSEYYRQSNEDLHQTDKRPIRNESKQNYHNSWRNTGRNSPRNENRNGYNNKRTEYDRENSNNNSGNYNNRRNLVRGGSVDSKVKDFNTRNRHDSFNRRNQENDNFEHFQSYNRKTYSRSKDNFNNRTTLPPRLQQKYQQQRSAAEYNKNDCDNPKRFNNKGMR